jgi:hypothetical protein
MMVSGILAWVEGHIQHESINTPLSHPNQAQRRQKTLLHLPSKIELAKAGQLLTMKSTTLITLPFLLVTSVIASPVNIVNKDAAAVVGCDGDCCYAADGICYPTSSLAKRDGEGVGTYGDIIGSVSGNVLQRPDRLLDFVTAWTPVGEHGGNGEERIWAGKKRRSLTGMGKGEGEEGEGDAGDGVEDDEDHGNNEDDDEGSNDDDAEVNDKEGDHRELDDAEDDADDGFDDDDVYSILPIPTATTQPLFAKRGGPGPNFETGRPRPATQTASDGRMPTLTMCWV